LAPGARRADARIAQTSAGRKLAALFPHERADCARMLANFGIFQKLSEGVDGLPRGAGRSIHRN
jgi:hypothetical protein